MINKIIIIFLVAMLFLLSTKTKHIKHNNLVCLEYKDSIAIEICAECQSTYQIQRRYLNDSIFIELDSRNTHTEIGIYDSNALIDTFKIVKGNWYKLYNNVYYHYFTKKGFDEKKVIKYYNRRNFSYYELEPHKIIKEGKEIVYVMKQYHIDKYKNKELMSLLYFKQEIGVTRIIQMHRHAKTYILVNHRTGSCE